MLDTDREEGPTPADKVAVMTAKIAHEANRLYCVSIGDYSQQTWTSAPAWQHQSAIAGVMAVIENPKITPADLHENWMTLKFREGWIWGEVKNPQAKEHPCLVPYEDLPEDQKVKDALFVGVVRAVLGAFNR